MARVRFTHLDRVLWPEVGITKRDLVDYYRRIAPVLLPHTRGRPFTIKRHYTVPRGRARRVPARERRGRVSVDGRVGLHRPAPGDVARRPPRPPRLRPLRS